MKDYKKAEQARQLLRESGVTYVFAYDTGKETIDNTVNGTGEEILNCIGALVDNLAGKLAEGGAPKGLVEMVVIGAIKGAIDGAYKEIENN